MKQPQFKRGTPTRKPNHLRYAYLLGFAVMMVVPLILIASKQSAYVNLGYELTELRDETRGLREERAKLKVELARVTSPEKVIRRATQLGLRPVNQQNRIEVKVIEQPGRDQQGSEGDRLVAFHESSP